MKKASKKTGLRINQISPASNVVLSTFMILLAAVFVIPVLLVISISFSSQDAVLYKIVTALGHFYCD